MVNGKNKWPSTKDLEGMLPELEKAQGTLHLNEDATPLEKFRFQLCQILLRYKIKAKISQRDLALRLDVDESIVSRIFHHRIDKISTDRLIGYVQEIEPNIEFKVAN